MCGDKPRRSRPVRPATRPALWDGSFNATDDSTGKRIAGGRTNREIEPLVRFAKEQPVTTAVLALGIGYLLGKIL